MVGVMTLSLVMSVAPAEQMDERDWSIRASMCLEGILEGKLGLSLYALLGEPDVMFVPPYRIIRRYWRYHVDVEVEMDSDRLLRIRPWLFKISPFLPAKTQEEMSKLQGGWMLVRRDGKDVPKVESMEVDGDYMTWACGIGLSTRFRIVPERDPKEICFCRSRDVKREFPGLPKKGSYWLDGDELRIRFGDGESVYQRPKTDR
jgi:uncharacterized protein (TIGR03067 family)